MTQRINGLDNNQNLDFNIPQLIDLSQTIQFKAAMLDRCYLGEGDEMGQVVLLEEKSLIKISGYGKEGSWHNLPLTTHKTPFKSRTLQMRCPFIAAAQIRQ